MNAEAAGFKVVVRRVANGSLPFRWQVERDDALAPVEVGTRCFRSMQEAYDAGRAWLTGYFASQPMTKRQPIAPKARHSKNAGKTTDEPLIDLEYEDGDETDGISQTSTPESFIARGTTSSV